MQMPDVNILVYAHRREDPSHEFYRAWVEHLANGSEPFALSALVAVAFVRIVTHPRFSVPPHPASGACCDRLLGNIEELPMDQPRRKPLEIS